MSHRIVSDISSGSPRFCLAYTGHRCLVENTKFSIIVFVPPNVISLVHPLLPNSPFESHNRALSSNSSTSHALGHRGAGYSDVYALHCLPERPLLPLIALLIALNAPLGVLAFKDPELALSEAAYTDFLAGEQGRAGRKDILDSELWLCDIVTRRSLLFNLFPDSPLFATFLTRAAIGRESEPYSHRESGTRRQAARSPICCPFQLHPAHPISCNMTPLRPRRRRLPRNSWR
ncbi:hypothetical protein B0H14DRAFT_1374577 [Mycena olivaceomarginata]|nr:hypothetical protein B0H14DRAFT_1374577 [Mycena olivaceomarginata]